MRALFRRFEVDGLDLDQGEIFFAFMRRTHLAADGVAGLEIEFADLRRRNVNIVRAGQIVVIGRAQEAVTVGQDFQHAFGKNVAFFFALRLQNLEDKVLLAQAAGAGEVQGARNLVSSVMFFSFSSAIVMFTYGILGLIF